MHKLSNKYQVSLSSWAVIVLFYHNICPLRLLLSRGWDRWQTITNEVMVKLSKFFLSSGVQKMLSQGNKMIRRRRLSTWRSLVEAKHRISVFAWYCVGGMRGLLNVAWHLENSCKNRLWGYCPEKLWCLLSRRIVDVGLLSRKVVLPNSPKWERRWDYCPEKLFWWVGYHPQ